MPTKQPDTAKSSPKRKAPGTRQKAKTTKPKAPARPKDCISAKDQAFADLYRAGPPELRGNSTACYKHLNPACSYDTARANGCTTLAKASIQAYLLAKRNAISDNADLTEERIMREVGRVAMSDVREIFTEQGNLKRIDQLPDDIAAAVSSVKVVTRGKKTADGDDEVEYVHEIKLADKGPALDKLMKWKGLYSEDNKQRSPLADLPPETLLQLVARLGGGS